ncbi:TERF1-interacting nuclear factor 2 isoform X2 [Syngnathus scovelli]|uniref:TERF1-interacting nuclear factor 2 isoform X2 n=1 Tax=Syngnathus scovelli TaxID=161590 RepID=UPI00210F9677|nr:TERF1-interacting nuclear factor 2 isoform X1 [Syngnathus scovelli]
MASRKPNDTPAGVSHPLASLQLLAPPVRLLSAALWKVMKQREVAQYGVLAEFVESTCDAVSDLLTSRHRAKLALGLRTRLILELLRVPQPDASVIGTHLRKIKAPPVPSTSTAKIDVKVRKSVESFHTLVHELLTDSAAKEEFFQEEFLEDYGPLFEERLEKLLWEFLIRLDQLLPVPSLPQTVSWLSENPAVLEECARAASQPQLLKTLLDHQACLSACLPPNAADSILTAVSLPLSGKVPSSLQQGPGSSTSCGDQPMREPDPTPPAAAAICGLLTDSDDAPAIKKAKRDGGELTGRSGCAEAGDDEPTTSRKHRSLVVAALGRRQLRLVIPKLSSAQLCPGATPSGPKTNSDDSISTSLPSELFGSVASNPQRGTGSSEDRAAPRPTKTVAPERSRNEQDGGRPATSKARSSLARHEQASGDGEALTPQKPRQPKVVIRKLRRCELHLGAASFYGLKSVDEKENCPRSGSGGASSSPQRRSSSSSSSSAEAPVPSGDDYVADSEDEGTKKFKERLFLKRYRKSKHGTFFPTLREFLKLRKRAVLLIAHRDGVFDRFSLT